MMDSELKNLPIDYYSLKLSSQQFATISRLVYQVSGIDLHEGKEDLVKARLIKRLRHLKIFGFDRYFKYLANDKSGSEVRAMVDVLTTNKTNFFREPEHLAYLRDEIITGLGNDQIRLWSAGCSSGEEPYSIAITLCEAISGIEKWDIKILATDISDRMIEQARQGLYDEETLKGMPPQLKRKYFQKAEAGIGHNRYRVVPQLQSMVCFAKLNLMDEWPMRGLFDVIFCRNVMIYFDKQTQEKLVRRFWSLLRAGGYLMVGHSESLTFMDHDYRYIKPAVYQKVKVPVTAHKKPTRSDGK
jgi:chemotaxis protein methyltransferase CheR